MLKQLLHLETSAISLLLLGSMALGSTLGHYFPVGGQWLGGAVDNTLLTLVTLLFFGVRVEAIARALGDCRFLGVALLANFILVPLLGYVIATFFLASHPLFMVGLMIYFMSPCTDWFLGFTRLSRGNVALGAALIPINMALQLLLYPVYLHLFTRNLAQVEVGIIASTLLQWFMLPLVLALAAYYLLRRLRGIDYVARWQQRADRATPGVIALLVTEIFASNISVIAAHITVFVWLLLAVFVFFVSTFWVGEWLSRLCRFHYPEHALLTMTIAARNAPLMLAVTMVVLPGQPLIYAALVIGMLVEFPHLTLLRHILMSTRYRFSSESNSPRVS